MFDHVIRGAELIDGSGSPRFRGDLAIKDGRIAAIAEKIDDAASVVIPAEGLVLCPGFIDVHRHADLAPFHFPEREMELQQGITTVLSGNCGFSPFPLTPEHRVESEGLLAPLLGPLPQTACWKDLDGYVDCLRETAMPVNMGTLVGNGAVRVAVAGQKAGPLSQKELVRACDLIGEALDQGAYGLSLGLMYVPENNYSTEELEMLCGVAAKHDAPVAVHLRGEGSLLIPSIDEMIKIAYKTGVHLHISHFKAAGRRNWGSWRKALKDMRKARAEGLRITWDAYPYDAGSTSLLTLLPPWAQEGGIERVICRLQDPETREKIAAELRCEHPDWDNLVCSTGWDRVIISSSAEQGIVGRSIAELAAQSGKTPEDMAFELLIRERGATGMVFFHMSPDDMREIICQPETALISDTLYIPGANMHPRAYGSQARLIGRYARDEGWMSMEEAVRRCTALPAELFGLRDRGSLRVGHHADLVLFDPQKLIDRADYIHPTEPPDGIRLVFVNGKIAFREGKAQDLDAGEYLLRV